MRRRDLLLGLGAAGVLAPLVRTARAEGGGPYLLVYFANGGWDQTYVFDPHFESSAIDRDPSSSEATVGDLVYASAPTRPTVDRFFADHAEHAAILNGLAIGSISHQKCTRLVFTGGREPSLSDFPTRIGAGVGSELAMPTVLLSGPRFPGTLGGAAVPFGYELSGIVDGSLPDGAPYSAEDEAMLQAWLSSEAERLELGEHGDAYIEGLSRYARLGDQIGELALAEGAGFEEQLVSGVAALSRGLARCVVLEGTVPVLSQWDTHQQNHSQQDKNFEHAFTELATVLDQLEAAPAPEGGSLADCTLVLALSEMGRTPVMNTAAGKDHWPYGSALLVGHGVRGGTFGSTDGVLAAQPVDLETGLADDAGVVLTPRHLIAGLFELFGMTPEDEPLRGPFL